MQASLKISILLLIFFLTSTSLRAQYRQKQETQRSLSELLLLQKQYTQNVRSVTFAKIALPLALVGLGVYQRSKEKNGVWYENGNMMFGFAAITFGGLQIGEIRQRNLLKRVEIQIGQFYSFRVKK